MENQRKRNLRSWLYMAADARILFYALPWLIILLTCGTVAQKEVGLYEAQKIFFSSWFLWIGPIPLPGAYLTLAVITLCLLVKFLFFSTWSLRQSGTILTHLGILILLLGGGMTALTQKEGFIAIAEGQEGHAISDYHKRIFRVLKDNEDFLEVPYDVLRTGQEIPGLPFEINVRSLCENCRPAPVKNTIGRKGLAEQISLKEAPLEKEAETNLSGLTFSISGAKEEEENGTYILMEEIPHTPQITTDETTYTLSITRAQREMPFTIHLKDFNRTLYPGTDMASGFSSDVEIRDGEMVWPARIKMNEPLRYKGYTIYQASFSLRPDGEYSVLSVVENKGRVFPYIASAVIFIGLLLHLLLRIKISRGTL